jgi:hypothetical protein
MGWHLQFTRCTHGRRRASAWVGSSMSPLLIADEWSLHVCDQQVRGSSSCHFKCQRIDTYLQFTRCMLDRRQANAWVGSSMEPTIDCRRLATPRVRPTSPSATRHEAGQDLRNSTSARGAVDAARAPMRSSLLVVDGWQLCGGRKIRDSNSCHAQCTMSTCGLKKHAFYCERLASSMCMPFHVRDELAYDLSK